MATFKAADDSRRLTLPKSADEYKLELSPDFKVPEGTKFEFQPNNPLLAQFKAEALADGMNQERFSKFLSIYAGAQMEFATRMESMRQAEIQKLGPSYQARVDAANRWVDGFVGGSEGQMIKNHIHIVPASLPGYEAMISKVTRGSGPSSFNSNSREPPAQQGKWTDEQYRKATPAERLDYARAHDQSQFQRQH